MSTPEFYVSRGDSSGETIDNIIDLVDRQSGRHTAQNTSQDTCGGGKSIGECATTLDLSSQLIKKVVTLEPNTPDSTDPLLFITGERVTVDMKCGECSLMCHATTRVVAGKPNERIRYMFEDPEASYVYKDAASSQVPNQPIIPTGFEGEYYKLDPGQLA